MAIASGLLALVLGGGLGASGNALRMTAASAQHDIAVQLAGEAADGLAGSGFDASTWGSRVSTALPSGDGQVTTLGTQLRIDVAWSGALSGGSECPGAHCLRVWVSP